MNVDSETLVRCVMLICMAWVAVTFMKKVF